MKINVNTKIEVSKVIAISMTKLKVNRRGKGILKAGDVFDTNDGGSLTVIERISHQKVVIEHNDSYAHRAVANSTSIQRGSVKNPYQPSVYGVGFLGVGDFIKSTNRVLSPAYRAWVDMMDRCYSEKKHKTSPTYKNCDVHSDWHNFQVFAQWYTASDFYDMGYELDKDLLKEGNKTYSEDNCVLLPRQINSLLLKCDSKRGKYPIGVSSKEKDSKFYTNLQINGRTKYIGMFDCPNDAHKAYVKAKEDYVKDKAIEWRHKIDERAFKALMNWRVL